MFLMKNDTINPTNIVNNLKCSTTATFIGLKVLFIGVVVFVVRISEVTVVVDVVVVISFMTSFGWRIEHENPVVESNIDKDSLTILKYRFAASKEHITAVTVNEQLTYSVVTLKW